MVTDQDHVDESSLDRDDMIDIPGYFNSYIIKLPSVTDHDS